MVQSVLDKKVDAYKIGVGHMQELLPHVVESYQQFTGECFREGSVSVKDKHLVALGISLFANNEVCTFYHVQEALANGAAAKEVMETVSVAAAIGGGHILSQGVTRVQEALDSLQ
jgi:alkylhydroperoxidase/carboxymuconolactone decarboxylase family protein YurZ